MGNTLVMRSRPAGTLPLLSLHPRGEAPTRDGLFESRESVWLAKKAPRAGTIEGNNNTHLLVCEDEKMVYKQKCCQRTCAERQLPLAIPEQVPVFGLFHPFFPWWRKTCLWLPIRTVKPFFLFLAFYSFLSFFSFGVAGESKNRIMTLFSTHSVSAKP